jgi:phosphoribosylanthranilate isomerase
LLVTAASRDGSLQGPDLDLLAQVLPCRLPVIAAGGVSSTADLVALRDLGCEAAVAGSALLGGRFTLPEARAALRSSS